jgi:hypothetical protein
LIAGLKGNRSSRLVDEVDGGAVGERVGMVGDCPRERVADRAEDGKAHGEVRVAERRVDLVAVPVEVGGRRLLRGRHEHTSGAGDQRRARRVGRDDHGRDDEEGAVEHRGNVVERVAIAVQVRARRGLRLQEQESARRPRAGQADRRRRQHRVERIGGPGRPGRVVDEPDGVRRVAVAVEVRGALRRLDGQESEVPVGGEDRSGRRHGQVEVDLAVDIDLLEHAVGLVAIAVEVGPHLGLGGRRQHDRADDGGLVEVGRDGEAGRRRLGERGAGRTGRLVRAGASPATGGEGQEEERYRNKAHAVGDQATGGVRRPL